MRADGFMKHNWLITDSIWLPWTERWSVQYAKFTFLLVCAHQPSSSFPRAPQPRLWVEPELNAALLYPIPFDNNHILLKTSWVLVVTGYKWGFFPSPLLLLPLLRRSLLSRRPEYGGFWYSRFSFVSVRIRKQAVRFNDDGVQKGI